MSIVISSPDFHEIPVLLILSKSCHGKAMASHGYFYIHLSMAGCGRAMAAVEVSIYPPHSFGPWLAMAGPWPLWRFLYIPPIAMATLAHGLPWQCHGHCGDFYISSP